MSSDMPQEELDNYSDYKEMKLENEAKSKTFRFYNPKRKDLADSTLTQHKPIYFKAVTNIQDTYGTNRNVIFGEYAVAVSELEKGNYEPLENLLTLLTEDEENIDFDIYQTD